MKQQFKTVVLAALALVSSCMQGFAEDTKPDQGPRAETLRKTLALDGQWQIAEGTMATPPATFEHTVPVPGLVDMATPAFDEVGIKSAKREAFWYRRTFKIEQPIPAVAKLKLHKAMFGCSVMVNGKAVGEQKVTFTPVYCDVKSVLRQGENEILIRVGGWLPDGKDSIGWDQEKSKFIPGLFDSVELILSGAPHIDRVQAVPDIDKQAVAIHAWPAQAARFTVREARSGKIVGEADGTDRTRDAKTQRRKHKCGVYFAHGNTVGKINATVS